MADNREPSDAINPPSSQHVLGLPRPPSVGGISSRATDIISEDDEQSQSYTGASSQPPRSQPSISRRGPPPARSSIAASSHVASRPGSSASRISRTHIPSLTAQGFFRPMSSQRLQAHRGRPMTKETFASASTDDWNDRASQKRRSLVSNSTHHQGSLPPVEQEAPPSRGTEFTDPIIPDRTNSASPSGNMTARSLGESARLLHERERIPRLRLDINANDFIESGAMVAHRSPASAAEQVEKPHLSHSARAASGTAGGGHGRPFRHQIHQSQRSASW